jgi:hypothetical protein
VAGPLGLTYLRSSAEKDAIEGLLENVDEAKFESTFGASIDSKASLIESKVRRALTAKGASPANSEGSVPGERRERPWRTAKGASRASEGSVPGERRERPWRAKGASLASERSVPGSPPQPAQTITISRLLEIAPEGVPDPTPHLYDTTFYVAAGFVGVAAVCNQLLKPPRIEDLLEQAAKAEALDVAAKDKTKL